MCGRYVLYGPDARLIEAFDIREVPSLPPRYNIAPTADILVVLRGTSGERIARTMRWGLVPSWAKDPAIGAKMNNARAETVDTKPAFRSAFKSRRCLIPANGFYEWQAPADPRARKQPWYISPTGAPFFAFAGLMERWGPRENPLYTTCIVTTDANALMEPIHDRMPVILAPDAWNGWLDPATPASEVKPLLRPAPAAGMQAWPVSLAVSNARNEGAQLIEAV
jgi:putative SOS response-associated peptidase YedK